MNDNLNTQSGIGLVEVLVSLLLLAIAVLGFTTLQMRSVKATDESLKRTYVMSVVRGLSEDIRTNVSAASTFKEVIESARKSKTELTTYTVTQELSKSPKVEIKKAITKDSCKGFEDLPCADVHIAARDAFQALDEAKQLGIKLGMQECPGTMVKTTPEPGKPLSSKDSDIARYCIVASWDGTEPVMSDKDDYKDNGCADENGRYKINANCIIVGAY